MMAAQVEAMARDLAAEPGAPRMPGDPEIDVAAQRGRDGIPIEPEGDLAMEMADILFVLYCMANREGIDLDAAFGRGSNAELLAAVIGELDVKVQLSGGIRDDASERAHPGR